MGRSATSLATENRKRIRVLLRGPSSLTLDGKGRVVMPAKYRPLLEEQFQGELVITVSPLDRCLWIYPRPEWEKVEQRLNSLPSLMVDANALKQLLIGSAVDVKLDGSARFLVPPELRDFVGITKDVMLLGQGNKFELWDSVAWRKKWETLAQTAFTRVSSEELAKLPL